MGLLWFKKHILKTNDSNSESSNESGKYSQVSAWSHLALKVLLFVSSIQRIHSWWCQWFNHGIAVQLINWSTRSLYQCFLLKFLLMLVGNVNRVGYGKKCEGQQETNLQIHQQQKGAQGKHGPTAKWDRGPCDKGHRRARGTQCLLVCLLVRLAFENTRSLTPEGKSGAKSTLLTLCGRGPG